MTVSISHTAALLCPACKQASHMVNDHHASTTAIDLHVWTLG